MKLAICSDIHLEFGSISLQNTQNAEVLILSGDICVAKEVLSYDPYNLIENKKSTIIHTFFQECCERFPHVIYIAGNHEHYHGDYALSIPTLKDRLGYLHNLHILDKEKFVLDDIVFVGGTLWTDMNKEDPLTMTQIRGYMNDYRIIENSASGPIHYKSPIYGVKENGAYDFDNIVSMEFHTRVAKFTPEDSVVDHKAMMKFISDCIADTTPTQKVVVVGHHAPSKQSTKPQYEKDVMVNGAYSSDLTEFILDNPKIKLWTHGHTHHEFDYMINSCRIVCNPRGYINYEHQADVFELKFVDV